jgi:hypothetical protein
MSKNTKPRTLSEKAKEGRGRRQRERRRRQREQLSYFREWDYDEYDYNYLYCDYKDDYYRPNLIFCDNKFRRCYNKDLNELSRKMTQIFTENNTSIPNNLKTYKCVLLDEFIAKTPPTNGITEFQISGRDLYEGKKLYNTMKDNPDPNYEIFGSNSCGYTCFILYKSNDKNMYIIVSDAHSDKIATHYVKIENENIFHD